MRVPKSENKNIPKPKQRRKCKSRYSSLLLRLHEIKQITEQEMLAGLSYENDCQILRLTGNYSVVRLELLHVDVSQYNPANDNTHPSEAQLMARQRLRKADARIGDLAACRGLMSKRRPRLRKNWKPISSR